MDPIKDLIVSYENSIPILGFIINFSLTSILSWILALVYQKYGTSLSNKESLAKILVFISVTTMLIITIVKSSLALSLGLVGALSIIRFRTAIKEPEELAYLFLAISIGLGFGANQSLVTITSFILIIFLIIVLFYFFENASKTNNMFITIECLNKKNIDIDILSKIFIDNCSMVKLHRYDTSSENFEAIFLVSLNKLLSIKEIEDKIINLNSNTKITFWENKI
tara:strand:+ start:248 stop:919 length:672 start_codon:yes stop_codon:yes gene_type:complete